MSLRDEMEHALALIEAAMTEYDVDDLAEWVAADREAACKPPIETIELREACRVFLGRKYGFTSKAAFEADAQKRIAEAKAAGPDAVLKLAEEFDAEARNHEVRADLLRVELISRGANGAAK